MIRAIVGPELTIFRSSAGTVKTRLTLDSDGLSGANCLTELTGLSIICEMTEKLE